MGSLRPLLEPKSVALVAGSATQGPGAAVAANLLCSPRSDDVYVIAPDGPRAAGGRWYASVNELPIVPDLAIICTPIASAVEALHEACRKGIKAAVIITADPQGADPSSPFKNTLKELSQRYRCRILGPSSAGINLPPTGPFGKPCGTVATPSAIKARLRMFADKAVELPISFTTSSG